jgi:hypothetical protein
VDLETAKAIMWLGLAVLFGLAGFGLAYVLWRTGRVLRRAEKDLHRTVDGVVPIIAKAGVSMDRVNDQLGKVDIMMDSAVDMTTALDTTVRAVSHAVVEPVRAVSSTVAGAAEAARSFRERVADGERAEPFDDPFADAPDEVDETSPGDDTGPEVST